LTRVLARGNVRLAEVSFKMRPLLLPWMMASVAAASFSARADKPGDPPHQRFDGIKHLVAVTGASMGGNRTVTELPGNRL
jgi:hypothetical protein